MFKLCHLSGLFGLKIIRSTELVVYSHTKLYDKRRSACYRGIPIVQYTHVSSNISIHCGYNILLGQLHRFRELITMRCNYTLEVARLVLRMQSRGYRLSILWRKVKHHLRMYPDTFGATTHHDLFGEVLACYLQLTTTYAGEWEYVSDCELSGDESELSSVYSEGSELSEIRSEGAESWDSLSTESGGDAATDVWSSEDELSPGLDDG